MVLVVRWDHTKGMAHAWAGDPRGGGGYGPRGGGESPYDPSKGGIQSLAQQRTGFMDRIKNDPSF